MAYRYGNREQAELSLLAICFNVRRLITLLGVEGMMGKLALVPV